MTRQAKGKAKRWTIMRSSCSYYYVGQGIPMQIEVRGRRLAEKVSKLLNAHDAAKAKRKAGGE